VDILNKIKQLVIRQKIYFTKKARRELKLDHLDRGRVMEAIVYAPAIDKKVRSKNPRTGEREYLYIIKGLSLDGILIYTKGKIEKNNEGDETFYVFISSKKEI